MILRCDVCKETFTQLDAEKLCITVGDPCPECEETGNDGVLECSYEDECE